MDNSVVANSTCREKYSQFRIRKYSKEHVNSEQYNKHKRHVYIMTEAGRPVYVRYGDEMEASSFIATMGAIIEKFRIYYFADGRKTSRWQKMVISGNQIHFLQRKSLVYICLSKGSQLEEHNNSNDFESASKERCDFQINQMLDFVNVQLISILTDQVNKKLESRPNYDPLQTLGDRNQLIGMAIKNGLNSPAVLFSAFMPCPLGGANRRGVHQSLGECVKDTGAIVALLISANYVVDIFKQKGFDFRAVDILLLQNLLQAQPSLRNSENWIPLCLPGMSADGLVYAYLSFLETDLALLVICDSNESFFKCKEAADQVKSKLFQQGLLSQIQTALSSLPYSHKVSQNQNSTILKHFILVQQDTHQFTQPTSPPFGKQQANIKIWMKKYAYHYAKFLVADKLLQNEYLSLIRDNVDYSGIYATQDYLLFFTLDKFISLPEINAQLNLLVKWIKVEESHKFIYKLS